MARSTYLRDMARADLGSLRVAKLERTMEVVRPVVPHKPSLRQLEFLALDCEEALFGGAAGGGKTDALVIAALQYIDVPEYSAIIFRRHETDFEQRGSAKDLLTTWLRNAGWLESKRAWWDGKLNGYRFASGASIVFGFAQTLTQLVAKYQGAYFQFIAFDELTQWPEQLYTYMFSRLRRLTATNVPLRVRCTANPGGVGHGWVKLRFITHARNKIAKSDARADIKAFRIDGLPLPTPAVYESPPTEDALKLAGQLGVKAQGAHFVPAFLRDNPGIDAATYELTLLRLDPVTRAQLKNGDWDVISSGNFFKAEWFNDKILKARPAGPRWLRSWDFAATEPKPGKDPDWTAGGLLAVERTGSHILQKRLVIADMVRFRESPGTTEARLKATAIADGKRVPILLEQEPGSSGKTLVYNQKTGLLFGWAVTPMPRTGAKDEYWKLVSSQAEAGNVYLVDGPWNQALIEELTGLPQGHDDQADCISLGFAHLTGLGSKADRTRMLTSAG